MLTNHTITVIGAGNIGQALIGGLIKGHELNPSQIRATRRSQDALAALAGRYPGLKTLTDNAAAVRDATVVILAVKPQTAQQVLHEIQEDIPEDALFISVLAGITTDSFQEALDKDIPVVRSMPNTPSLVDEGATAICAGHFADEQHLTLARHIFQAVGKVEVVEEYLMDAVTGLSGSGPAYVYMFIEALTDAGVKQGLPRSTSARLAAQTVFGAAKLALETDKHPAILRDEVTTPGGTAIAAVSELESHGLRTMLINTVATATNRSKELSEKE